MKLLQFGRAFGAAFALVLIGAVVGFAANSPYWQNNIPGTSGPWLGDANFNIMTLWQAHVRNGGLAYTNLTTVDQTAGQANCTQLNQDGVIQVTTSAATGYLCLPTAVAGKITMINNATGSTIDLYSSATSYTSGTADTINGTAGTTAYTKMTTGLAVVCFTPNNGAWSCISGS